MVWMTFCKTSMVYQDKMAYYQSTTVMCNYIQDRYVDIMERRLLVLGKLLYHLLTDPVILTNCSQFDCLLIVFILASTSKFTFLFNQGGY